MKKIMFFLAALTMLAACNSNSEQNTTETAVDSAVTRNEAAASTDDTQDAWPKQSTLLGSKPMVIDFFATWCGPCKQLSPILDELEKKYEGEVIFKRIDVDKEPELAQEFGIEAIPTLMFVTPKGEYQMVQGYQEAPALESQIAQLLSHSAKEAK